MPRIAHRIRRCDRHGAGTASGLDHLLAGPDAHGHQNESDVLRIEDLRGARQVGQQVRQRRLKQEERRAHMAEHLRPPCLADQVVVQQHAAMRLEFRAGLERNDEMLVPQPDEFCNVAVTRSRGKVVEGHPIIVLPPSRLCLRQTGSLAPAFSSGLRLPQLAAFCFRDEPASFGARSLLQKEFDDLPVKVNTRLFSDILPRFFR